MSSSKVVLLLDILLEVLWLRSASHMINRRGFSNSLVVQVYLLLRFFKSPFIVMGTAIRLILRLHSGCIITNYLPHCSTRQVTGSIPDGIIGIFQ